MNPPSPAMQPPRELASLSCVVPCYNEARNLEQLLPLLRAKLASLAPRWEIVLVDDGEQVLFRHLEGLAQGLVDAVDDRGRLGSRTAAAHGNPDQGHGSSPSAAAGAAAVDMDKLAIAVKT